MKIANTRSLAILIVGALLQACTQAPDPATVRGDVAKAQAAGQKKLVDAQANLDQVNAQSNKDVVDAQVDARAKTATQAQTAAADATELAKTRADSSRKISDAQYAVDKALAQSDNVVALARCESQTGNAATSCVASANAALDVALTAAKVKNAAARQDSNRAG